MAITINGTTGLAGVDGSAGTPAVQGGDTNTGMFFPAADTAAIATGGVERMRVDSSGNVGIGTASPTARLHSIATSGTTTTLGRFEAAVGGYTGTSLIAANTLGASSTYNLFSCITDSDGDAGGPNTQFLVRGDGSVLVGTTSVIALGKISTSFDGSVAFGATFKTTYGSAGSTFVGFINSAGTQQGSIYANATNTVQFLTSSDYRLKENIAPMTGALAKVSALKPVTYNWKVDGSSSQGFIAHELAEVSPECVGGEKDAVDADGNPKYQGVDTSFLVATLTAAIQEQQALITQLQADVAALKGTP